MDMNARKEIEKRYDSSTFYALLNIPNILSIYMYLVL